jgi:xylulokinase
MALVKLRAQAIRAELVTVNSREGAAFGAALLAATGTGVFPNVRSVCLQVVHITGRTTPGSAAADYDALYPIYRQLYPSLKPSLHGLGSS